MKKTKTQDPICRSFRQDFPQFVERAEALGVKISLGEGRRNGRERVFWLDGYKQLTGYSINSEGCRFTLDDAERHIDKVLTDIEEDRAAIASMSIADRFARVMTEFRQMESRYRMIGEVRMPGGDRGHVWFMSDYEGAVDLRGVGTVAKAKVAHGADQMARFCDMLEADFAQRQTEVAA